MNKWLWLLFAMVCTRTAAQTCCSGGVPLSSNIGFPASEKGRLQASLTHDFNVLKTLKDGTNRLDDNSRLRRTHSILLSTGYTITERISFDASFSYVWQVRMIQQPGLRENTERTNGFGDAMFLLKYQLTNPQQLAHTLLVGLGGKIPTGTTDNTSIDGIPLNLDLQPGSGAFDAIYWVLFTNQLHFRRSASFNAVAVLRKTGVHDNYRKVQTYEIGDNYRTRIGVSDQYVVGKYILNGSLNLWFRYAVNDKIDNQKLENTGGKWIFLNPEIRLPIAKSFMLSLQLELPIYANIDGEQLSTTYRAANGIYYARK